MTEKKLLGKTILNIRPLSQALPLAKAIEEEGGRCIVLPSIEIVPLLVSAEKALLMPKLWRSSDFLLFVSQYAVPSSPSPLRGRAREGGGKIAAIGKATTKALKQAGIPVDLTPEDPSSEGLLCLPELQSLQGKTITIFRGKSGRTFLDETLKQRGALVNEVMLYERILPTWTKEDYALITHNTVDLALGLSVDSLTYFFSQLDLSQKSRYINVPWLVMSQRVAEKAKSFGIKTVYTVSKGDVLGSLIRCCSPGILFALDSSAAL